LKAKNDALQGFEVSKSTKKGQPEKTLYYFLFTDKGLRIKNMINLPEEVEYFVVSAKNKF
jgi:hypothetical protein